MKYNNLYFKNFHPVTALIFFICAVILTICCNHPVFLIASFIVSFLFLVLATHIKYVIKNLLFALPLLLFMGIVNALFNHRGSTALLYINNQPVTLEAICYGFFTGLFIITLIFWFKSMGAVIDSYRFLYLFGHIMPTLALMASMIVRFIPYFRRKLDEIQNTSHALGVSTADGKMTGKLKSGNRILSILVSVSLENSIDTADSMRARGYNLKNKTHYHKYKFSWKDSFLLCIIFIAICGFLTVYFDGLFSFSYYPYLSKITFDHTLMIVLACYGSFLGIPVIYHGLEALKWHLLISKD